MQSKTLTTKTHLLEPLISSRRALVLYEHEARAGWSMQLPAGLAEKLRPQKSALFGQARQLAERQAKQGAFKFVFADKSGERYLSRVDVDRQQILVASDQAHQEFINQSIARELAVAFPDDQTIQDFARTAADEYALFATELPIAGDFEAVLARCTDSAGFLERNATVVQRAQEFLATRLAPRMRRTPSGWRERGMQAGLAALGRRPRLRDELLQFVVLLPTLAFDRRGREVRRHAFETLRNIAQSSNGRREFGLAGAALLSVALVIAHAFVRVIPARLFAGVVRAGVRFVGRTFIAGEDISQSEAALAGLERRGKSFTIDQLGELVMTEAEADRYSVRVLETIDYLSMRTEPGQLNAAGIPLAHVSIKVSALSSFCSGDDPEESYLRIAPRLKRILEFARDRQVFINADAEHYPVRDLVPGILFRVLRDHPELRSCGVPLVGVVLQAYLKDSLEHLAELSAEAGSLGIRLPVRLVKGAYWDEETASFAAGRGGIPQFQNKVETDANFRLMADRILAAPALQLSIASHNPADHSYAVALRDMYYPDAPLIEHQCLYRSFDSLGSSLAGLEFPVREYLPVGDILIGMSYLVRRLLENSSQNGFLAIARMDPREFCVADEVEGCIQKSLPRLPAYSQVATQAFLPADHVELFRATARQDFLQAPACALQVESVNKFRIDDLRAWAGLQVSEDSPAGLWLRSGRIRALILNELASRLHLHRGSLAREIVIESNKTPGEAFADVNEAIDFLRYYAAEQLRFENGPLARGAGSRGGIFAVICPWNFPLAIPCGMVAAALVTGNRVVFKPAEQTPRIGAIFASLAYDAGVPPEMLMHAPGDGAVGQAILAHPEVTDVVFTGSYAVGSQISAGMRARLNPTTGRLARVITEMGGKNAIVITASADFDEALAGVLYAVLGHAGQKCSACSRLLIDERIADRFLKRLQTALHDVVVGEALSFATLVNPLIASEERQRVREYLHAARAECVRFDGRVLVDRSEEFKESEQAALVGPVLLELPPERFRAADSAACREAFAPIVHAARFNTIEAALDLLNATDYALTAGIYTQSVADASRFLRLAGAGNLYINRPNTGARVAIEPFGGFLHSGTGPKAGGPNYLPAFRAQRDTGAEDSVPNWETRFATELERLRAGVTHYQIPGQINLDSITMAKKQMAVFHERDSESRAVRLRLFAARALGVEVHSFYGEVDFEQLTREHPWDHIFVDGSPEFVRAAVSRLLTTPTRFSLATSLDGVDLEPATIIHELVQTRSIAINSMRYGADLQMRFEL